MRPLARLAPTAVAVALLVALGTASLASPLGTFATVTALTLAPDPATFDRLAAGLSDPRSSIVLDQLVVVPSYVLALLMLAGALQRRQRDRFVGPGTVLASCVAALATADTLENLRTLALLHEGAAVAGEARGAAVAAIRTAAVAKWASLAAAAVSIAWALRRVSYGPALAAPLAGAAVLCLSGGILARAPSVVVLGVSMCVVLVGLAFPLATWAAPPHPARLVAPFPVTVAMGATIVGVCALPHLGFLEPENGFRTAVFVGAGVAWALRTCPLPGSADRLHGWLGSLAVLAAASGTLGLVEKLGEGRIQVALAYLVQAASGADVHWADNLGFWVLVLDDGLTTLLGAAGVVGIAAFLTRRWSGHAPEGARRAAGRARARAAEERWIATARERRGLSPSERRLGLACSGGGIRAASFTAGVLQALEHTELLPEVDVITAVSGGSWAATGWWRSRRPPSELVARWRQRPDFLALRDWMHSPFVRGVFRALRRNAAVLVGMLVSLTVFAWSVTALLVVLRIGSHPAEELVERLGCKGDAPLVVVCDVVEPPPASAGGAVLSIFGQEGLAVDGEALLGISGALLEAVPLFGVPLAILAGVLVLALPVALVHPAAAPAMLRRTWRLLCLSATAWAVAAQSPLLGAIVLGLGVAVVVRLAAWRLRWPVANAYLVEPASVAAVVVAAIAGLDAPVYVVAQAALDGALAILAAPWTVDTGMSQGASILAAAVAAPFLWGVAWFVSTRLDRDRLSLHALWREAIADVFRVDADLRYLDEVETDGRPLLVLVTSANVPETLDPHRRERGTVLFEWTPEHAGSDELGWTPLANYAELLDLSDVVAISSAAVSSQMGFGYPRLVQWVAGALNLRLGRWLPNPGRLDPESTDQPHDTPAGFLPRLSAELGLTGAEADPELFVTDGGHDENTGLVSLLRRGVTDAILVDAESDPRGRCAQIKGVLRRLRAEEGWTLVDAHGGEITPDDVAWHDGDGPRFAIELSLRQRGRTVRLLCLRLALPAGAPRELVDHQALDPAFPTHETWRQSFSTATFAAYEGLGACAREPIAQWWGLDQEAAA